MKKILAVVIVVLTLMSSISLAASAIVEPDNGIEPLYNNTSIATVSLSINSSGLATIGVNCRGINGVTTQIVARSKLERKFGLLWLDVDGAVWTDTVYGHTLGKSHTFRLSKTGTYRLKTTFTVSGSGGANDTITATSTDSY